MKHTSRIYFVIVGIAFMSAILMLTAFRSNDNSDMLKAGAAKINITPEDPVRMSGYAARTEPFKGIHDELFASALVFENNETRTSIISVDVIGFSHEFVDETREMIEKKTGIPAMNILLAATHNHGGPRTRAYGEEPTDKEKAYVKELQKKLIKIAVDAADKLQPVKIGVGTGSCQMNVNRRARHAEGGVWLGRNPGGICDHEVGVIRVDDLGGNTMAMFVNWPCHATTGGQENYQITGDWPGATARELEKKYPETVVLVSAGASGDINPVYGPNTSFNDINAIGQTLATEVIRINEEADSYLMKDLEVSNQVIQAKGKKPGESRMPNVSLEEGPDVDIRVSSMKIGNVLLASISGELMNEIGLQIKEDSPYKHTFVISNCNGNSGYLCTDISYKEGGYEPMVARTMPGTEKKINDTFKEMNNGI